MTTNEEPTICDICQRVVDIQGGEGYYQCIKCNQEVCSECCDNAPDDSMSVICDECWPPEVRHSWDDDKDDEN